MNGFSDEERGSYKGVIFKNLFENMRSLISAAENFKYNIGDKVLFFLQMKNAFH